MVFLLGADNTPSDEERNPCASAITECGVAEYLEYPQLHGEPKMGKQLGHGKIFRHRQDLPGGAV